MNATSLSIEPEDLELSPFLVAPKLGEGGSQRGGLGNLSTVVPTCGTKVEAHQLFGPGLPGLLDELNKVLAA